MTPQPRVIFVDGPDQAATARRVQAFYQLGMPGMTLRAAAAPKPPEPAKPKPIIPRCACGQPISSNKTSCRFCLELRVKDIAEKIESQEVLDQLLSGVDPAERAEALARLKPYLKFKQDAPPA